MTKQDGFGNEKNLHDPKATIWKHLNELRRALLICLIAIFVGFIVIFMFFSEALLVFLSQPLIEHGVNIINIGLAEPFVAQLRVSMVGGVILASPIVVWQIWSFLRPGLFPKERKTFRQVFFVTLLLFILGVLFAYFYVFGITVSFFLLTGENVATPQISIDMYIGMLLNFVLPFGLAFQFPVVIYFLHQVGIVTVDGLKEKRKYIIFAIFVLAALITPPDVISKVMLALPMCLLYELSIIFLKVTTSRKKIEDEPSDTQSIC